MQQSSKIWILNAELKTLRKQHEQLIDIHTRHKSQEHSSTASQTDQVAKYCNCCELMALLNVMGSSDPYNFMFTYISTRFFLVCNSYNVTGASKYVVIICILILGLKLKS